MGATSSSFREGNFHEISFHDVIVLIQPAARLIPIFFGIDWRQRGQRLLFPTSRNDPLWVFNSCHPAGSGSTASTSFPLLPVQMGMASSAALVRRRTNRPPWRPPLSNPSTSPRTTRPDGSGRWDNRMAAQHLPRYLGELAVDKRRTRSNERRGIAAIVTSLFRYHGWSSPRWTMMFFHCVLLRAVSHKFPGFLHKPLKLWMKVKRWAPLVRFPGILLLRARSSSSSLRITWPKNLSCLCSIQQSSLRSCLILWRTDTLAWYAAHGMRRILR